MSQPPIEFTNRNYLLSPKEQTSYPVEARDLKDLEKMIGRMDRRDADYKNWGIGMVGISIGSLNALISLSYAQAVSLRSWVISWVIFLAPLAVAAFAFYASRHERYRVQADKQDVLERIQRIRESVHAPEAERAAPSA